MSFLPPPPEHHDGGEGGSWRRRNRGRGGRELQHDKNWCDIRALGASAEQEEKVKSLMIQGYAADLVADDETALALHQENHMIRWRGQEDDPIIIDRFDGRALLDDRSKFAKMKGRRRVDDYDDLEQAAEEAKLDKERYSDLVGEQGSEEDEGSAADGKGGKGKFGALGFQYGGAAGGAKGTGEDAPFTPSFEVPEDMVLPSTIRVHRIIGQTARRIREKPQLEFLLKIKQADNATFSFLQDSDSLHPYYLLLKEEEKEPDVDYMAPLPDEDAKQKAQEEAERQAKVEAALKKRAVKSLLGNAYYSDDEEADDEVLEPGPEMKAVMEKLATFVKRNGKAFEDKVAEREANNPRFAFLKPDDIFHKYYRQLVDPSSKADGKPEASEKQATEKPGDKEEQQQQRPVEQGQESGGDKAAAEATDASKHGATTSLLLPPTGKADTTEPSDAAAADSLMAAAARAPADVGAAPAASDAGGKDSEGVEGSGNTSAVEERVSESEGGYTAGGGAEGEEGQTEEMRRRAERLKRARMMQGHFKIALLSPPAPAVSSPVTASATDPSATDPSVGQETSDDVSKAVAKYIESEAKQSGAGEQGEGDGKEGEEPHEPHDHKKKSKKKHKKKDKHRDRSSSAHDDDRARKKKKAEAGSHSRDRSTDRRSRRKDDEGRSRERDAHKRRDRSRSRSCSHSDGRRNKRDRSDSRVDRHRSRSRGRKKRR